MSASYLRRWLLQAVLFLAAASSSRADCPKPCGCPVPSEVQCTFKYLTAIPDSIEPAVERLNLGYNSLTALRENELSGLENLKLLLLHSNSIHSIEDRSFQDLKSLQVLKMSFNKVKRINKETFKGLNSLQRLHMDQNHIEFISPEAFYGLTNLLLVHLEGNHLQQLHPDTFITLRHSQVFKVSSVRNIHLSDNLLTTLPADIFTGCSQLENLFLHGNPWTCDCRMEWFSVWAQRNTGVLKCKRDRRYLRGQLCPVCQNPGDLRDRALSLLPSHSFTCTKPWIQPHLKQKNISLDEGDFTPVSPKDFIAPLGSIQINFTDHFHNDGSLSCSVQRPSTFENLTQTLKEEEGTNVTLLSAGITAYLVCNIDYEHMQQLWQILAVYSDFPMRLERDLMLTRSPEMVFRYSQTRAREDDIFTNIKADIKTSPAWLMQEEVSFQLDRTATTFSTLHIKYQSVVNLRVENTSPKKDRYSWTMIKYDNGTKTEHTVVSGGVIQLNCQIQGEPKPLLEWILPDGTKVRAPYSSEDQRIIISADGKLTVRGADTSDTGVYRCIATNYLDADILMFRVTVLSPDVEETEVNGVHLSRQLGENVFFDCSSSGSPEASVQWILPDHLVLDKSHGHRKVHDNGTLLIQGLTPRDRGFYRCLAANRLGADLLVSQLTLTEKTPETALGLDSEGSGMVANTDPSLTENTVTHTEIPYFSPSDRNSQESRTVISDPPHPRLRSQGRGGARSRAGQRRRGPFRHRSSTRGFGKSSRRVDPQKFAEFMKKAQDGLRLRSSTDNEPPKHRVPNTRLPVDGENGSGEEYNEDDLIITPAIKSTADNSQEDIRSREGNRLQPKAKMATHPGYSSNTETAVSDYINLISEAVTPDTIISHDNISPVTLQVPVSDSSQETQLQHSGEQPAEPETSTWAALSFTTDPNVTPMRDSPGPVEHVVHTSEDLESKTTYTAVTTTEMLQNEITFHTTQTIKSPRLPAGSTIISQQHIHIIPHKNGRGGGGGGRRRSFQGRRRIIKPSRIADIQSFFNKLKQPSENKKANATVSHKSEQATDYEKDKKKTAVTHVQVPKPTTSSTPFLHRTESPISAQTELSPEVSRDYITSADALVHKTTMNPSLHEQKEVSVSTTAISVTTASKVIRGRIPWNRLFGSKEREKILGRLKRPYMTPKTTTTTTAETTTTTIATTTAAIATTTTANSLSDPDILHTEDKDGSLDDVYDSFSSGDFDFPTLAPTFDRHTTTDSSYYSRSSTTTETPTVSKTLPSPPTVRPPSVENPDETVLSGSGALPDTWHVSRRRPGWTRGRQGRRKRPFRGRRPFNRPNISRATPSEETAKGRQQTLSPHKPLNPPSRKEDKTSVALSTDQNLKEEIVSYDEFDWTTSSSLKTYSTTETPLMPSTSVTPTNTIMPTTTEGSYVTIWSRIYSNIRPPTRNNNGHNTRRQPVRRIRPTVQSRASSNRPSRPTFNTVTTFKAEDGFSNTPAPHSNMDTNNGYYSGYDFLSGVEPTSASIDDSKSTQTVTPNKPKIVGGNAASFTVLSNSDAFLPCGAVGDPQPTINWMRFSPSTGSAIALTGTMGKFEVLNNGTLVIQNAGIKDRGQYLCVAENDYGSDKLFVTLSVVAYPSRILEPKLREVKSLSGNTVRLTCKADGRPMPTVSWILANQTQVRGLKTEKSRVSVTAEGTLVIEQVSVYDRGHYKCIASNPAGADTAIVRLQVVAAPPGIIEEKRQLVKVSVSQNLWLPCTGQGSPKPTIHWVLHDGSELQSNRPTMNKKFTVHGNGTLHIKDATEADSGSYECIATSSTGSERRVVILTVERQESAPQIVETSQRRIELSFGDQLTLNCSATGDPKPRIMWRLPSRAVVDQWHRMGSRIQVLDNGTLIVSAVSEKDAGNYLCVARNKISDDLQLMRVSVSLKPAKIEEKLYEKKQVAYGNDVKVDCKASGAPKPDISWSLPDGTMVSSALQSDVSSGGGRARRYTLFENGTLYLNQVGISEEGDYTCYAENQVGKDEMIVHISVVTTAPKIRPSSQTFARVKPGGSVRFDCEAVGEPKPKILWILPSNDVIAASNERYLMHVNGSLDIRDVKVDDAGEYVCMARNPAGETRKLYQLDIDGNPPIINGYKQNRTVIKDVAGRFSRKLIDCKVEGNPTPSVTWIMPDNIFLTAPYFSSRINVHFNGTLEIRNVRPTDTGEFMCLAKNDGGEAVMVVQLEVTSVLRRPIFKNPFNKRVVSHVGKATVLNCSADGHPLPEIVWTLPNGIRVVSESNQSSRYYASKNGSLIIYSPRKEDAGKYRCGARNFMGYIEKLIILDIGQDPYIVTRPRGVIRNALGEPLFLHCLSDGNPKPTVSWTIPGGHTLTHPHVIGRYQLLENGTLVVQDTSLRDRGNYVCRARNDAGQAMLTVPVVIIAYPPRITALPSNIRAVSRKPVQLNCAAVGVPKPEISWELPDRSILSAAQQGQTMGTKLLHPQGTLIIQRPSASDTGTYKCLAKNHVGTDSKVTYVQVL